MTYLDIANGRLKEERVTWIGVRFVEIRDTEYARLLKRCGFAAEPPQWRPAHKRALGLMVFSREQRVHYEYGEVYVDLRFLAQLLQSIERGEEEVCQRVAEVEKMLATRPAGEVRRYLQKLAEELLQESAE